MTGILQDVAGMAPPAPPRLSTLFRRRQLWIATPHDCFRLQLTRILFQNINTFWFLTLGIPDLGLPVVQTNDCLGVHVLSRCVRVPGPVR